MSIRNLALLAFVYTSFNSIELWGCADELIPLSGEPSKEPERPQPAFPMSFNIWDDVPPHLRETIRDTFSTAISVVAALPPNGDHYFNWKGDRAILNKKEHHFIVTSQASSAQILRGMGIPIPLGVHASTDAATMAPINRGKSMKIFTFIYFEKIFYDAGGNELPDGLARLIVALAHEIYGNVQTFCFMSVDDPPKSSPEIRKTSERRAFEAGIEFIQRLVESPFYNKLPPKMRNDLKTALERERRTLKSWQQ